MLKRSHILTAKKKSSDSEPILKPSIVEEVSMNDDEEDGLFFDDLEDGNSLYNFIFLTFITLFFF